MPASLDNSVNRPDGILPIMPLKTTRTNLLVATASIIGRDGVASLTLEAVACEAGVSKGGLLYHFKSKRDLIIGLIDYHTEIMEQRIAEELRSEPDAPGRWLRAYIRVAIKPLQSPSYSASMIASIATDPSLLAVARRKFESWREQMLGDGLSAETAQLVHMTLDGWRMWRTFQFVPEELNMPDHVVNYLIELTRH